MWSRIRPRCATLLGKSIAVAFSNSRSPCEYEFATDTFDFLGFTHYCAKARKGRFMVKRKTQAKRS